MTVAAGLPLLQRSSSILYAVYDSCMLLLACTDVPTARDEAQQDVSGHRLQRAQDGEHGILLAEQGLQLQPREAGHIRNQASLIRHGLMAPRTAVNEGSSIYYVSRAFWRVQSKPEGGPSSQISRWKAGQGLGHSHPAAWP